MTKTLELKMIFQNTKRRVVDSVNIFHIDIFRSVFFWKDFAKVSRLILLTVGINDSISR